MFGENLKRLRQEKGISLKKLADAIDVSDVAVLKWEKGVNEPKMSYLISLADYFGISIDELVGRENDAGIILINKGQNLTGNEKKFIELLRGLNAYQQGAVMGYISCLHKIK